MRTLTVIFIIIFVPGCASTPTAMQFTLNGDDQPATVWPPLPEVPRLMYAGKLTGEENFRPDTAPDQDGLSKFLRWVVGLGQGTRKPQVLQRPTMGAVGDDGRIYVADASRQAVWVFDRAAGRLQLWSNATSLIPFVAPAGIAISGAGQVLVADAELRAVYRLDADGEPVGVLGEGLLGRPTGVAHDTATGRTYVADTQGHDIKMFNADGSLARTIGRRGTGMGEFNAPSHIAVVAGKLYVSDTLNARVQVLSLTGEPLRVIGKRGLYVGNLIRPKGITADDDGNVYVIESYYDHLLIFSENGELLLPIGGTGQGTGQFFLPSGVWRDDQNRLYVADMFNGRVVILQYLGG